MWQKIFNDTGRFLSPKIIQSPEYIPFTINDFTSVFKGAKQDTLAGKLNYFRGYRNGMEDYSLAENFLKNDFDRLPLEQIINEYFGNGDAIKSRKGMIVNGVLQWSEYIQKIISHDAERFSEIYDNDLITLDITLFIGAYGNTPFGVHVDDSTHRTILINLGPSKKCIQLWENIQIEEQFGSVTNVFTPKIIKSEPEEYCFLPGQYFVLPSYRYHMAVNDELSTTAAIVVDLITKPKAAIRELGLLERFIADKDTSISSEFRRLTIDELAEIHIKRCKSNSYLRYPISLKNIEIENINRQSILVLSDSNSVQWHNLKSHYLILSKGHHYIIGKSKNNLSIDKLFDNNTTSISNLVSFIKECGGNTKSALLLVKFLLQSGGVEAIN